MARKPKKLNLGNANKPALVIPECTVENNHHDYNEHAKDLEKKLNEYTLNHEGYFIQTNYGRVYLSKNKDNEYRYYYEIVMWEEFTEAALRSYEKEKTELQKHHLFDHFPDHNDLVAELRDALNHKKHATNYVIKKLESASIFLNYLAKTKQKIQSWNLISHETLVNVFIFYKNDINIDYKALEGLVKTFSELFNLPNIIPKIYRRKQIVKKVKGKGLLSLPSSVMYQLEHFIKQEYHELKETYIFHDIERRRGAHKHYYNFRENWENRPFSHDVYPLILLLMMKHGMNFEVLKSWKVHKENDTYVLGDSIGLFTVIDGVKNRSNSIITTVLENDSLEKKYIELYLNIMNAKQLYDKNSSKYFFQYFNSNASIQPQITPHFFMNIALATTPYSFYKKYEVLNIDGKRIERLDHRRLRPSHNYQQFLQGKTEFERQIKKNHKDINTTATHYENSAEWKGLKRHKIAAVQNILVSIFRGEIIRSDNQMTIKALKLFNGPMADCKNNKNPTFKNAPKLKENQLCGDWTKCLSNCEQSCVIPKIHGPVIYAWINYLEIQKDEFLSMKDWEKEYQIDYDAALDTVSHFTKDEKEKAMQDSYKYKDFVKMKFQRILKTKEAI